MRRIVAWLCLIGALLSLLLWSLRDARPSRRAAPLGPVASSAAEPPAAAPPAVETGRVVPPLETAAPSSPPEPEPDPRVDWLEGTVVAEDGAPVPGAHVTAQRAESSDSTLLWEVDPGFHARLERVAEAETGDDGRFRFRLPRGLPFDLEASKDGAEGTAPLHCAGEDVVVKLLRHALHGRLTRLSDGEPVSGALVRVFSWPSYVSREARSGSDGAYRVTFPFDSALWVEVLPLAEEATPWRSFELEPDGEKQLDLVLADGVPVVGRVTEAVSGRPLAGAIVGEGWQFRRSAVADAEGRYRLAGIGGAGAYGLAAKASGHGMVKLMTLPSVVSGVIQVDFELPRAWGAAGRVVDRTGAPVANAQVVLEGYGSRESGQVREHFSARSDADGRFHVGDLTAFGRRHILVAGAPGLARHSMWVPDAPAGDEVDVGDIVLEPATLVSGRVLAADGRPLPEAEVEARSGSAWRSTWTDALGRFAFGDLEAGAYTVRAKWNSRAARPNVELVLATGEIREGLELRLPRGESLSGRVIDESGSGVGGLEVTLELTRARDPAEEPGERVLVYGATDEEGAYRFDDLLASEYYVHTIPRFLPADPEAPWMSGGERQETGSGTLEITLMKGETIRGRVLDADGAPLVNFTVSGRAKDRGSSLAPTDAHGNFELLVERGTTWDLVVSGPSQGNRSEKELLVQPGVAAGTRGLELRLSPAPR